MELTRLFTEKPDWATAWLVQVFGIVFLTLVLDFILRRFLNRLQHKALDSRPIGTMRSSRPCKDRWLFWCFLSV